MAAGIFQFACSTMSTRNEKLGRKKNEETKTLSSRAKEEERKMWRGPRMREIEKIKRVWRDWAELRHTNTQERALISHLAHIILNVCRWLLALTHIQRIASHYVCACAYKIRELMGRIHGPCRRRLSVYAATRGTMCIMCGMCSVRVSFYTIWMKKEKKKKKREWDEGRKNKKNERTNCVLGLPRAMHTLWFGSLLKLKRVIMPHICGGR